DTGLCTRSHLRPGRNLLLFGIVKGVVLTGHMKRREFITLLGNAAAAGAWPLAARAQQPAMPVIGYLSSKEEAAEAGIIAGVRKGLAERGFVEGENVTIMFRWSAGHYDRLPQLA